MKRNYALLRLKKSLQQIRKTKLYMPLIFTSLIFSVSVFSFIAAGYHYEFVNENEFIFIFLRSITFL